MLTAMSRQVHTCMHTYISCRLSNVQYIYVSHSFYKIFSANPSNLLCGCTKTGVVFSSAWLDKVIADTGSHYLFPAPCTGYIDPDGHCHEKESSAATLYNARVQKAIPKMQVRGVAV